MMLYKNILLSLMLIFLLLPSLQAAQTCTTEQIGGSSFEFNGISGSGDNNVIAVRKGGDIWQYDNTITPASNRWSDMEPLGNTTNKDLKDVEVVDANTAFAVGNKNGKDGTVLYYNGTSWSSINITNLKEDLKGVWAAASDEAYVVGKNGTLYSYNGSWNDKSDNANAGNGTDSGEELVEAWGNSTTFYALSKTGDIYPYDRIGDSWPAKITACNKDGGNEVNFNDLWGDSAGDLYLAGEDKRTAPDGTVYKYDIGTGSCDEVTPANQKLEGIYGSNTTGEIYAVGKSGLVVYYNSSDWVGTTEGSQDIKDVWVSSEGNAYYAAKNGYTTSCTYTTIVPTPASCSTTTTTSGNELKGVSGSSDSHVIAAGKAGELYLYDGSGTWSSMTSPTTKDLNDVEVVDANIAFAVGKKDGLDSTVLYYNGSWSSKNITNFSQDLNGVWAAASDEAYVVGKNGTLYSYNGSWNDKSGNADAGNGTDSGEELVEAWGNSTTFYALSKTGDIYPYDRSGDSWPSKITTCNKDGGNEVKFNDLWGDSAGNLYLAGEDKRVAPDGTVYKYDIGTGSCDEIASASEKLEGIYGSNSTSEIYAVGKSGKVVYYNGSTWTESTVGGQDLNDVWVSSGGIPYYAGKGGTLTFCELVPPLHHIEITHDVTAITCNPEDITFKSCANAECTSLRAVDVSVNLSPTGWVSSDTQTIDSGNSSFQLKHYTLSPSGASSEELTFAISSSTPTADNPFVCKDLSGNTTDCKITFYDSGFLINVPTQTSCQMPGVDDVTISAVRKDVTSQQCVPAFANKTGVSLQFSSNYNSPNSGSKKLTLNYADADYLIPDVGDSPSTKNITVNFDANGKFSAKVKYDDAGKLSLNTNYTGTGAEAGLTMAGNGLFVTKPHGYFLQANSGTEVTLNNTATSGTPTWKASDNFRFRLRGQCQNGTVTSNYVPTNAQMLVELTQPVSGGTQDNLTIQGTNYVSSYSATPTWHNISNKFSNGAVTDGTNNYANAAFQEVGVLNLHVKDSQYIDAGVTLAEQTLAIGRFTPHHFDTLVNHGCTGGSTFTYSGQPFRVTAAARNNLATPETTLNYEGTLAKTTTISNAGITTDFSNNTITASAFSKGFAQTNDPSTTPATAITYSYPLKDTAPSSLTLRARDTDLLTAVGTTESTTEIRSGRTYIENVFGSELTDHNVPSYVQYFDGSGFVANSLDTCTTISATLTDIGTDSITIGDGSTTGQTCIWDDDSESGTNNCSALTGPVASQFEEPPIAGSFNLYLKSPGQNFTGDIGVTLMSPSWLKYDWDDDTNHDNDPSSAASFGLYRGDDRVIYWREVF